MGFIDPTDFRWLLPTETDANSPISEELMSQLRENGENNTLMTIYTGLSAQVVTRDSGIQLTIEKINVGDVDWASGEANALIVTMTSGTAIGQNYTVLNNTALNGGSLTATLTTTDTYSADIIAGDTLKIMYLRTGSAHTHDGIDSPIVGGGRIFKTYDRQDSNTNTPSTPTLRLAGAGTPNASIVFTKTPFGASTFFVDSTSFLNSTFGNAYDSYGAAFYFTKTTGASRIYGTIGLTINQTNWNRDATVNVGFVLFDQDFYNPLTAGADTISPQISPRYNVSTQIASWVGSEHIQNVTIPKEYGLDISTFVTGASYAIGIYVELSTLSGAATLDSVGVLHYEARII